MDYKYPWLLDERRGGERLYAVVCVYLLYHWGRDYPEGKLFNLTPKGRGSLQFEHAEDFLVRLEQMKEDHMRRYLRDALSTLPAMNKETRYREHLDEGRLDEGIFRVPHAKVLEAAKLLLALECEEFSKENWEREEEMNPYRSWVQRLGTNDAIVTFNYDGVVELLLKERALVLPDFEDVSPSGEEIVVCKMHGSTDWQEVMFGEIKRQPKSCAIGHYVPFIAVPGRSKVADTSRLKSVWDRAEHLLRIANEIYIIGYGMPESDAKSRAFLLDTLVSRRPHIGNNGYPTIRLVLGEPNFRVRRIEAIIKETVPGPPDYLTVEQMYAQDFLQSWASKQAMVNG